MRTRRITDKIELYAVAALCVLAGTVFAVLFMGGF